MRSELTPYFFWKWGTAPFIVLLVTMSHISASPSTTLFLALLMGVILPPVYTRRGNVRREKPREAR